MKKLDIKEVRDLPELRNLILISNKQELSNFLVLMYPFIPEDAPNLKLYSRLEKWVATSEASENMLTFFAVEAKKKENSLVDCLLMEYIIIQGLDGDYHPCKQLLHTYEDCKIQINPD